MTLPDSLVDDPDEIADRAKRYIDLGRHPEAERIARRGLHAHPRNSRLLEQLSLSLHKQERHEEDLEVTRSMMIVDPEDAWAFFRQGWALSKLDRHQEALVVFAEGLRIDPHHYPLQRDYAKLLDREGRSAEALKVSTSAMAEHPDEAQLPQVAGQALTNLDRFREATGMLTTALALDPHDADTWYLLGWNQMYLDEARQSLESYATSLRLAPEDGPQSRHIRYLMSWPFNEMYNRFRWTVPFMACAAIVPALTIPTAVWPFWLVAVGLAGVVGYSGQWAFRGGIRAWRALLALPWPNFALNLAGIAAGWLGVTLVMLGSATANPFLIGSSFAAPVAVWLVYAADRVTDPSENQEGPLWRRMYDELHCAITFDAEVAVRRCKRAFTWLRPRPRHARH